MAGINLGFDAGEILFCNSCFRKSESGVPRYVALHSTLPSFATAHMNMTSASFWPFLTRSCSSMRLINAVGPCPINTGRYIGRAAACAGGVALARPKGAAIPCDQATLTIESNAIRESARMRMGKYASGAIQFFKRESAHLRSIKIHLLYTGQNQSYWVKVQSTGCPLRKPGIYFAPQKNSNSALPKLKPGGSSERTLMCF